jgi:heme iron utilization protein
MKKRSAVLSFIENFKSLVIGSIDEDNHPFSSYAPYVYANHRFYIFISDIATHAKNLQAHPYASVFFIEDEASSQNIFARKRISLQCDVKKITRDDTKFESIMEMFETRFGGIVGTLKGMQDFNLYELKVYRGEATFGFGEAYTIGGENMDTLHVREGGSGHKEQK